MPSPKAPKPQVWIPAALLLASLLARPSEERADPEPLAAGGDSPADDVPQAQGCDAKGADGMVTALALSRRAFEKGE